MANSEDIKPHASRLTAFLGLQRSAVGVLSLVLLLSRIFEMLNSKEAANG